MNCSEFVSKQNEVLQCIYLIFTHFKFINLQPQKFHCHYSKFQEGNLCEIYSLFLTVKNSDQRYELNFVSQVRDQYEGKLFFKNGFSSLTFLLKSCHQLNKVEKYCRAGKAPDNVRRRSTCIVCWITKAKNLLKNT